MLSIQTPLSIVDICLPLALGANLHASNNRNVLKLLIWRLTAVLAFALTPSAHARELVLAQGAQVVQYLAAESAIKMHHRLLGMRQLQALVLNPETSPVMRQHLGGADQIDPRDLSQIFLVSVCGKRQSKFCNGYHVDHAKRSAVAL